MISEFFKSEEGDFRNIFSRFKNRNFSGNTGQAIKNSSYQLTTNVVMKLGSLAFTIIIARILMPELFGLYSLALATIVLFSSFSDLGIGSAIITFVSKALGGKNEGKAKAYFKKLMNWKVRLLILSSLVLLASSYFIANLYYNKPIFYALLLGGIYIPVVSFVGFVENAFKANENFKSPMIKEIVFQISRLIIVPLGILLALKFSEENSFLAFAMIFLICIPYFIGLIYLLISTRKKLPFLGSREEPLSKKESKDLKKFVLPLTATTLSGVFFGYIDTIMLGHFVSSEFISYYGVAFSLIASASAIIEFASSALFPLFSKLEGKSLENLFKKGRILTLFVSVITGVVAFLSSKLIIQLAYGSAYVSSVFIMQIFSFLLLILPLSSLYGSYFISRKKTLFLAKLLIVTTVLNIVLNFGFISYGVRIGETQAVYGAVFATIISRVVYFLGLVFGRK